MYRGQKHRIEGGTMIKHQIKGNANQMVVCQVDPGQTVFCEAGKFLWKTANVSIETRFSTPEQEEANKEKSGLQKFVSGAKEVGKRALAGPALGRHRQGPGRDPHHRAQGF